jgi:Amt family ammonium transporter
LQAELDALNGETDTVWIMISAFLVFFMQAGFAMLEMGTVRSKNAQNILIKNMLDVSIATLLWFTVG